MHIQSRQFRLAGSSGDGRHAYVNEYGAFIGFGVPLIEKGHDNNWVVRSRPALKRILGHESLNEEAVEGKHNALRCVVRALEKNDPSLAVIALLHAQITPFPTLKEAWEIAEKDHFFRKYNPGEPRVPAGNSDGGEWTSGGSINASTASGAFASSVDPQPKRISPRQTQFADGTSPYETNLQLADYQVSRQLDAADAVLLEHKNADNTNSQASLNLKLDSSGPYSVSMTLIDKNDSAIAGVDRALNGYPFNFLGNGRYQ